MLDVKQSKTVPLLLALAMGLGASAAYAAQSGEDATSRQLAQSTQQNVDVSEEKLESFVEAREEVVKISRQWEDRLNNADSQEKLNSLQQQAQEEMVAAVRDNGLSVNEYNMIVDASQTDPELRERVNEMVTQ